MLRNEWQNYFVLYWRQSKLAGHGSACLQSQHSKAEAGPVQGKFGLYNDFQANQNRILRFSLKEKKRQSEFISKKKKNVSTINLDISVHTAFQYIDMRCFLHKLREKIKHNIGVNKTRLYQVNLTHKVLKMWDFGQNIFKQTTLKHHTQTSIICQIQTVVHWPMSNRVFPL